VCAKTSHSLPCGLAGGGDGYRNLAQIMHRGARGSHRVAGSGRDGGQRLCRLGEHVVADPLGPDGENPKADTREDTDVVGLIDGDRLAVDLDRRNGLPVPTSARPLVQRSRSAGVASLRETWLESGKMTGRATAPAIVRTTSSVNTPGWPDTPISTVGAFLTTSSRSIRPGCDRVYWATASRGWTKGAWKGCRSAISSANKPSRSTAKHRCRASASGRSSSIISFNSKWPMPQPAVPAYCRDQRAGRDRRFARRR
jgi:hypothetical protein